MEASNVDRLRLEWLEVIKKLSDVQFAPLYDGCVISGGIVDSQHEVLSALRTKFSNKTLFAGPNETQNTNTFDKAALLARMVQLVGAQRRKDFSPVLERMLECMGSLIGNNVNGMVYTVDVPYFTCICHSFPIFGCKDVVFLYFAQWMTGVC
jgi:hypothetical protein